MEKGVVLKLAKEGYKKANEYDQLRPGYTEATVNFVLGVLRSETPQNCMTLKYNVLEVGAGTGKWTAELVPKLPAEVKYLATEPSKEFLSKLQSKSLPVDTAVAAANHLPLKESSVQSIIGATCFHWFHDEKSIREMYRVLVPGGKLILVWNAEDFSKGWPLEVYKQRVEIMTQLGASTDNAFTTMKWRKNIESSALFSMSQHNSLPGIEFKHSLDTFLEYITTISSYSILPQETRADYLQKLRNNILSWPDVKPDEISFPHTSEIYIYTSAKKQ